MLTEDPNRAHERRLIEEANRANERIAKLDPSWRMSKTARDDPNCVVPNVASEEPRRAKARIDSVDETSISFAFMSSPSSFTFPYAESPAPMRR
jgi:outer membrane murein-binding lipoprotein Lpp